MSRLRVALSILLTISTFAALPAAWSARHFDASVQKTGLDVSAFDDDADRGAIGIKFAVRRPAVGSGDSKVTVLQVVKGGPADRAGLRKDDLIILIDGHTTTNLDMSGCAKLIRGEPGTKVNLTVERRGAGTLQFDVERGGLRSLPDPEFRKTLTHQFEDEERKDRLNNAQRALMVATGRASTYAKCTPPLNDSAYGMVTENCNEARFSMQRGDFLDAERRLKVVLKRFPQFIEARMCLGLLLDALGRFAEARTELQQVVAANPKSLDALQSLAMCEQIVGDRTQALKDFKKCVAMCSDEKQERAIRIKITALQDEIAATGGDTKTAPQLLAEARKLISQSDYEQAERLLKQAVAVDSKYSLAWEVLGTVQQKNGDATEAMDSLQHAFESDGNGDLQLAEMISSASHSGEAGEMNATIDALKTRLSAASPTENVDWARMALAYFFTKQERYDEALDQYNTLLARESTDDRARALLLIGAAMCNEFTGRFDDALNQMERAVQMSPPLSENRDVSTSIAMLREIHKYGGRQSPDAENYLAEIRLAEMCRWNLKRPLKVYIAIPNNVPTYREGYDARVRAAFDEWAKAMPGLSFVYVTKPGGAQIRCEFTDDRTRLEGAHRLGLTRLTWQSHRIQRADVLFLTTVSPDRSVPISEDETYTTALHEIGHALGVSAHSSNSKDIMFPFVACSRNRLSDRDIRTLTALYQMPEPAPDPNAAKPQFNFVHN
jgi:tetratricopeptide (TPR) repeat protein